jgi:tetratricopeptide (TPR) repeat protein
MNQSQRTWVKWASAILAPVLFLALLEGLLALGGVQPIALTEDPLVGFSGLQPLFLEEPSESGVMRTNPAKLGHFNDQTFPLKKPAGAYRIFALGGSTTYGHPWRDPVSFSGWLRGLLPTADASHTWEVINAGGISYASYREVKLVEEIIRYQPDLILVYCGHNEFLEERTYRKIAAMPRPLRALSTLLDRTRTYSLMRRVLRKVISGFGSGGATAPESKPSLSAEVDDVLQHTIGPETYVRDDTLRAAILDHYRLSLERMAALATSVGARVLFMTTPANERDCSPFKSEPTPGLQPEDRATLAAAWMRADSLEAIGHFTELHTLLASIVDLDPRNADLLYRTGKAALAAGRHAEAKRLLVRALEEDICPLRALPAMRDIIRDVAHSTGSEVLDITASLEAKSQSRYGYRILGEPEFVDHVHLSIDEYRDIAMQIVRKLAALGVTNLKPEWKQDEGEAEERAVVQNVMARMGSHDLGEGLHNIAKVLAWSGKYEDAARTAARALTVDSTGLEAIWSSIIVGTALERQGRSDLAVPHYRRAVLLDTTNEMSRAYLRHAVTRSGLPAEAALAGESVAGSSDLDKQASALLKADKVREALALLQGNAAATSGDPTLLVLLGEAQLRSGQLQAATSSFKAALVADSKEAKAYLGLGRITEAGGDISGAVALYAKALSLRPDFSEARAALARSFQGNRAP